MKRFFAILLTVLLSGVPAVFAQTYTLAPYAFEQFFDNNGDPLAGGKIYSYIAGTTTAQATYANSSGTPNGGAQCTTVSTCLVLDSAGRGVMYLSSTACYKLVLTTSSNVIIQTQDNVCANASASTSGAPVNAGYITKTANATLTNEFALSTLATGILKNTTTTGVPTIAVAGSDYIAPGAALTNNRVVIVTGGTIGDDADLTFLTDTLTATKESVSTSLAVGGSTPGAAGSVTIGTSGTTGTIALVGSTSGTVSIQPPASALTNWTLTLPTSGGASGYVLRTDGSGTTSWVAQSGGGGTPGGVTTQIQYNSGGSFAGFGTFTYDPTPSSQTVEMNNIQSDYTFTVFGSDGSSLPLSLANASTATSTPRTLSYIEFTGRDSAAANLQYAGVTATAVVQTTNLQTGKLVFNVFSSGSGLDILTLSGDSTGAQITTSTLITKHAAIGANASVSGNNVLTIQETATPDFLRGAYINVTAADIASASSTGGIFLANTQGGGATQDTSGVQGVYAQATNQLPAGRTSAQDIGVNGQIYVTGGGTTTQGISIVSQFLADNNSAITSAYQNYQYFYDISPSAGTGKAYGVYQDLHNSNTYSELYGMWVEDFSAGATLPYYLWFDSPGVYRVNGDGIEAYYNPAFTKYTPGAANFERVVTQWKNNVAEIGTEWRGTGTFRDLRLIGNTIQLAATTGGIAYVSATTAGITTTAITSTAGTFTTIAIGTSGGGFYPATFAPSTGVTLSQTVFIQDATAATGRTKLVVKEGAGQSSTPWVGIQDTTGTDRLRLFGYSTGGQLHAAVIGATSADLGTFHGILGVDTINGLSLANPSLVAWSSTTQAYDTKDAGISRNTTGVIEINSGTKGTYRDLIARTGTFTTSVVTTTGTFSTTVSIATSGTVGVLNTQGRVFMSTLTSSSSATAIDLCMSGTEVVADTANCITSAARYKHDIQNIDSGLDTVMKLRPVNFLYNEPQEANQARQQVGFIADEAEKVDPRLVTYGPDGQVRSFLYIPYTAVLTRALQEQQLEILDLQNRVRLLEAR